MYDVIILGAGTWGSSAAWHLAERGQKVLAIDAFRPPHGHGSHGGATRLARQSNSMGPEYSNLIRQSGDLWQRLATDSGTEVMWTTGNVLIGAPGSWAWDATMATMADASFPYEIIDTGEARRRFPRLRIADGELALWEPGGAVALVPETIRAMQALARAAGAEFRFDEPVTGWDVDDDGVTVRTAAGTHRADRIVVTSGAFSSTVLRLDLPTAAVRQVLANFTVDPSAERLPAAYFAGPVGADVRPTYGCPEPDGTFKLSVPKDGDAIEPEHLSQDVTADDIDRIVAAARDRIPELTGAPVSTTVCMWTEVDDGDWLVGAHPESDRVVIGAGCNGRGFRYAPVMGQVLADLSLGVPHAEITRFRPDRFDLTPAR